MAKLGKCLVFYLKYSAEMDRLYCQPRETEKDASLDGLKDKDKVLSMIKRVGDAACRDAASFLEACAEKIEPHLQSIGIVRRKRKNLEYNWSLEWNLSLKKQPDRSFWVGVYVDEHVRAVVPWIWCRGGRRAEDEVVKILGRGIKGSAIETENPGTVVLDRITVGVPNAPHDFDVEQDPLVTQVCKALTLQAAEVKAIAGIASRSSE